MWIIEVRAGAAVLRIQVVGVAVAAVDGRC